MITDRMVEAAKIGYFDSMVSGDDPDTAWRAALAAADAAAWLPISSDAFEQEYVLGGRFAPHVGWRPSVVKWKPAYPFTHWRPLPASPEATP